MKTAKLRRADIYMLIILMVLLAFSLALPFESEILPGEYDIDNHKQLVSFGYESRICFAFWIAALILILTGLFKNKTAVIALTVFFAVFFFALLALGYTGGPFHPAFQTGFYLALLGCLGAAVYAHFLALRK